MILLEPANTTPAGIPAPTIALILLLGSMGLFAYLMFRRYELLTRLAPDMRFDRWGERFRSAVIYGFGQFRQPRYLGAGVLHILLFAGFLVLSLRSITLIGRGFDADFHLPFLTGDAAFVYEVIKDYTVLIVLAVCVIAIIRRAVFKPARYAHGPGGGGGHENEAYIILGLVSGLMITDMVFDGSALLVNGHLDACLFPGASMAAGLMSGFTPEKIGEFHLGGYWLHLGFFFGLLNYLPLSKHFHVITAIPNTFFAKLDKGGIKPVSCATDDWMALDECGVGKFEAFTWKHALDFYSCADCGRCTDNCPANAVGRALSPKMISIKCRDYAYDAYPVFGTPKRDSRALVGEIITEQEIWACTTCGACEQECPILIEYIDKIVDMRRYLLDKGELPQSLQKPMQQIKKKGNAYGAMKQKRVAWTKELDFKVRELKAGDTAEVLYFVDGCGSFDPRIQELTRSFARIMHGAGVDFGILGQDETDAGNEVRRLGEEGLFEQISQKNIEAFEAREFRTIVAFDPHAFNTIKNDYPVKYPVIHSTTLISDLLRGGRLRLTSDYVGGRRVVFQDPCYLGRHNGIYSDPRFIFNCFPKIDFREMERTQSRSFCCSGGGLLLWYENEEEKERMGERRVKMAMEVGADMIVTACPFCLINLEDAVKTTGNEGKIEVIDMVELVDRSRVLAKDA